ncbi:maltose alpha-D-glucosyltransferase [Coralloluteibacterium stylophorae]|uniref:Maltokinase n=1 Tax=Coralloluteibacterium stylophorae TaxID=1776034 RepID=A0AAP2CD80_9GAMM|nr:maltose alpha-D-glucosyltransferase [Coralloluteibacterium stylophorae]MBS7457327.1 maltose alpha-D-glucosyltransferase [Coralloluteibacterium stylophorae]
MTRGNAANAEAILPDVAQDALWYKDAIIYQAHVKSFFDSNDDGIGDFPGLIAKLDYIADLGVNAIWLLPFYPSPRRDDGYDIAEYMAVHPDYGSVEDFQRFVAQAHARGIRVITELVINHTSDQHPWFQRARTAPKGSPERDFYVWSDDDHAYAGTRIIFCDTEKSNWTWDPVAEQYFWHRFYSHQPDLNFDNPAVLEAVLEVMRFWLDMGVDGLRLDAVPYLIEREGTSNENLAETHAILKRIRATLDREYPDRMLLAEANMWPEDTQQYFGETGDECHMAFHFPLMPRMYMAIAREDRFPITDIMRQTPAIPANCQWAIFLRNHDELTLEMVTDSERDYLWQTYASDRRARINLGIRRRLAPLLERDRRRIELMTSLLLTMPGTPVLYYGDEIGMGDNIHLGDRDGVRTPMQWSIDRNGGFSRADPAALVLPPIMDPLYGFQAINVEAQQRDQHSLLTWTRRILSVRKRYKAFGRGELRFLYPGNRRLFAYLREYEDETLLCVANLSHTLQAVELDLSEFEGRVPVDVIGGGSFPPVGRLTYLLTVPAFGFYAFQLVCEGNMPDWHRPTPVPLPDYQTFVLRGAQADAAAIGRHFPVIEREILPAWLSARRWFAAKDRELRGVRIARATPLPGPAAPVLLEIEASLGDGGRERYMLPVGMAWEREHPSVLAEQLALARVRHGREVGYLTDAFALESLARGMVAALRAGTVLEVGGDEEPVGEPGAGELGAGVSKPGELRFQASEAFGRVDIADEAEIRWLSAEQSNSSLIIGDAAVFKLLRRVVPGENPEIEIGRRLTALGYANAAPLLGEVTRVEGDGAVTTIALLQGFVRNQGDAWRWTLDHLARGVDAYHAAQGTEEREEVVGGYDAFAAVVGRRLAELHEALAQPTEDAAFAPDPADERAAKGVAARVREQVESAWLTLASRRKESDDAAEIETLDALLAARGRIDGLLDRAPQALAGSLLTRVHGDFHLGQILVAFDDVVLIDFEGEPARTLAERRAKASPLRDVAGFLRSLDYASEVAARGEEGTAPRVGADTELDTFLAEFRARATRAFVTAYRSVLEASLHPWVEPGRFTALAELFLVEKACYEIRYEAANRPNWLVVPVQGLLRILDSLPATDEEDGR